MTVQPLITRVPEPPGPSDRMQFTKFPPALPGSCVICNTVSNGSKNFLDPSWSLDYYGALYFCTDCLTPMSHAIGFVEVSRLLDAEREAEELTFALRAAEDEREHYRSIINSLRSVRPDLVSNDFKSRQDQESDDSGSKGDDQIQGSDNRESTESSTSG